MDDEAFIGYCDLHCETERALFSSEQINRMLDLAGNPMEYVSHVPIGWHTIKSEMKVLCEMARKRLAIKHLTKGKRD